MRGLIIEPTVCCSKLTGHVYIRILTITVYIRPFTKLHIVIIYPLMGDSVKPRALAFFASHVKFAFLFFLVR
jgi:hypothetical protein